MPDGLFLTTRKKTIMTKALTNNISISIKVSKKQLLKITQSGEFPGKLLGKFGDPLVEVADTLAKKFLAPFATIKLASSVDHAIQINK